MNKNTVATNLKKARAFHGWSQDKAASQLRIRRSTLASYEEARALPSITLLPVIADVFQIVDWKGFISNPDFKMEEQTVCSLPSLIELRYNQLSEKEKNLAKTLLNLP
jgi:transcriptional regulator with XRE-family HTH domain